MSDSDTTQDSEEFLELDEADAPEVDESTLKAVEASAVKTAPPETKAKDPRKPATEKIAPARPLTVADADRSPTEHPFLSAKDIEAAKAKARERLSAERRAAAMKAIEEAETARLQREEGFTTGDGLKDELVSITLDLAPHSQNVTINSVPYWHGFTYDVPRHVADTIRDIQAQGWKHQDEIDGKDLTQHYQANRKTFIKQVGRAVGVAGAPKSFAAEEIRA